jgi:hypothetical protein
VHVLASASLSAGGIVIALATRRERYCNFAEGAYRTPEHTSPRNEKKKTRRIGRSLGRVLKTDGSL